VIVVYGCQSQEGYLEEGAAPSGTVPGTSDSVRYRTRVSVLYFCVSMELIDLFEISASENSCVHIYQVQLLNVNGCNYLQLLNLSGCNYLPIIFLLVIEYGMFCCNFVFV
jgi:hypothetical protein